MQFTVALIPRYYVIYDLPNMSIQKSANLNHIVKIIWICLILICCSSASIIQKSTYEDSDSCMDSDVSCVSSQAANTHSYPLRNNDKCTNNAGLTIYASHTQFLIKLVLNPKVWLLMTAGIYWSLPMQEWHRQLSENCIASFWNYIFSGDDKKIVHYLEY